MRLFRNTRNIGTHDEYIVAKESFDAGDEQTDNEIRALENSSFLFMEEEEKTQFESSPVHPALIRSSPPEEGTSPGEGVREVQPLARVNAKFR